MEIEYYVVERDNKQEIAVTPESIVNRMDHLERFAGSHTPERLADHWYSLKQDLAKIATQPIPEEPKKGKDKKK